MSLTPRQHRLLSFIVQHQQANGYTPTVKQMAAGIDSGSTGYTHTVLMTLERRGYVKRLHKGMCGLEILRLPDDISDRWLRTVTTKALLHELDRRGVPESVRYPATPEPLHG